MHKKHVGDLMAELTIQYVFWPEREAPLCHNPDSPLFGDPGDPPELEFAASVSGFTSKLEERIKDLITNDEEFYNLLLDWLVTKRQ